VYGLGLVPVIIENVLDGDELITDVTAMERKVVELGADNIVCVMSTTSVFAPRAPDRFACMSVIATFYTITHASAR
jgi:O-phospho-L-seryl-tRNASec:L-selenocysteinyl-tRNA synthase